MIFSFDLLAEHKKYLSILLLSKQHPYSYIDLNFPGKDAKRSILLAEECESEFESTLYRESVAKKYASYFQSTLHHNNGYFLQVCIVNDSVLLYPNSPHLHFQFFACEILNFVIDVLNIYMMDAFLGGRFMRYGTQVLKYYRHPPNVRRDLPNPMCTVFPTVTR